MPPKSASKSSPTKKNASNGRPSSPTSLVWAHQLKREHAFLVQKMDTLENGIKAVERNAKNNDSNHNIAKIAGQVQALISGGDTQWVRNEVMKNIESLQDKLESVISQVAELTRQNEQSVDVKKKQSEAEEKVLKRVKDVEEGLAESRNLLREMGKSFNEEKMDVITANLQEITEKVRNGRTTTEKIGESLKVLEEVARVLREDNDKVAVDVRELRERKTIVVPMNDTQESPVAFDAGVRPAATKTKKKAAPCRRLKAETAAASQQVETAASRRPRKSKVERELARLQIDLTYGDTIQQDRNAHHAEVIDKRLANRKVRGMVEQDAPDEQQTTAAGPTQSATQTTTRGRGAVKRAQAVVATTEVSQKRGPSRTRAAAAQAPQAPSKRGRPRKDATQAPPKPAPKRHILEEEPNEHELAIQTQPPPSNVKPTRKRKADTLLDEFISPPQTTRPVRSQAIKLAPAGARKKPQLRRGQMKPEDSPSPPPPRQGDQKGSRRGLTNVWSQSPISSSMSEGETQQAFGPGLEPAGKRSKIKEESSDFDEDELLRRLSRGEEF
ncbi:hypothetical protein DOTSEDRAFT_34763 [Dothistroma septosporum NZE10]|uniref:Uncharacterized protein n=1 Tax=Dothistroma septosporum (strain NZE10 / CBS 128990) TaxID=675120 RepID=N1PLA4_DOTSN|nr:hypothetical protein DOTSEDRAFT_34763 [Dothistroma septosporum NZE10]